MKSHLHLSPWQPRLQHKQSKGTVCFLISSPPISFPFLTQLTVITFHFNNHYKTRRILLRERVNSPPAGAHFNTISFEHPSFLEPCLVWEIGNTVLGEDHVSSILTVFSPLSVSGLVIAMYSILHGSETLVFCLVYGSTMTTDRRRRIKEEIVVWLHPWWLEKISSLPVKKRRGSHHMNANDFNSIF